MNNLAEPHDTYRSFYVFVFLTLVAYISRIAELFPVLMHIRINFVLFATTLFLFFFTGVYRTVSFKNNRALLYLVLFIGAGYLSVPFSFWRSEALHNTNNLVMINFAVFIYFQSIITSQSRFRGAVSIILISCMLLLFGIFFRPQIIEGDRITTTMTYDPNDIALIFAFCFPLAVSYFVSSKFIVRVFMMFFIAALIYGILKTGSRGGILALGISMILILFSRRIHLNFLYKFLVILAALALLLSPKGDSIRHRFELLIKGEDYNTTTTNSHSSGRLAIWKSGMNIFVRHFITGVGTGTSYVAMGKIYGGSSWRTMHNSYLQAAVEMGFLGFLSFICMLFQIFTACSEYLKEKEKPPGASSDQNISYAAALQYCIISYMVSAFFLSQAFSIVIPLTLALSSRLHLPAHHDEPVPAD